MLRTVLAACIMSCVLARDVSAQWRTDGLVMPGSQASTRFEMHPDGSGGVLAAYDATPTALAQRIDSLGVMLWPADHPLILRKRNINSVDVTSVSDGSRGLIVLARRSDGDLRAQRVDATGALLWGPDGVATVLAPAAGFYEIASVPDGAGGAFVVWLDIRSGAAGYYATHLLPSGTIAPGWAASGNAIVSGTSRPLMSPDGSGGVYFVWTRTIAYPRTEIAMVRMTSSGDIVPSWPANGLIISPSDSTSAAYDLALVGTDVIVTWTTIRPYGPGSYYTNGVYAQRVTNGGTLRWGDNGRVVRSNTFIQSAPRVIPSASGVVIVWEEHPDPLSPGSASIHAQRLDVDGAPTWGTSPIQIVEPGSHQFHASVIADGAAGFFVVWIKDVNNGGAVVTQHVDATGSLLWAEGGIQVSRTSGTNHVNDAACLDGEGGLYVGWLDQPHLVPMMKLQRVLATGELGYVAFARTTVSAVTDVPMDQGGWVRLALPAPANDRVGADPAVTGFNVWRRDPAGLTAAGARPFNGRVSASARAVLMKAAMLPGAVRLGLTEAAALGFPAGTWESVGFHAAARQESYALLAPTRQDSTSAGDSDESYVVTIHMADPNTIAFTPVASGRSVDNVAPGIPSPFEGTYGAQGVTLNWGTLSESDLLRYRLYRGSTYGFPLDDSHQIFAGSVLSYFDEGGHNSDYYKLMGEDRHGNRGAFALVTPPGVTGTLLSAAAPEVANGGVRLIWHGTGATEAIVERLSAEFGSHDLGQIVPDGLDRWLFDDVPETAGRYGYRLLAADATRSPLTAIIWVEVPPAKFSIRSVYPNPSVGGWVSLRFSLATSGPLEIELLDLAGRRVHTERLGVRSAGEVEVDLVPGHMLAPGIYQLRARQGADVARARVLVTR